MPQIFESKFRVLGFDNRDVLINEIVDTGLPIHVGKERSEYSRAIRKKIDNLRPGNITKAEIQSESVARQDDFWKFIKLDVIDESRFHFVEHTGDHPSVVLQVAEKLEKTNKDAARTTISSDGRVIGLLTVGQDKGSKFWHGLKTGTNTHEFDIKNLETIDDTPYEVIYIRDTNRNLLVFYHLADTNTSIARALL